MSNHHHHVPFFTVADKRLPFSCRTAHEMRRLGRWPWLVRGPARRLWVDLDGLQKYISTKAPAWAYGLDLKPLWALAEKYEFDQEAAKS
jgi:hypothetical protein